MDEFWVLELKSSDALKEALRQQSLLSIEIDEKCQPVALRTSSETFRFVPQESPLGDRLIIKDLFPRKDTSTSLASSWALNNPERHQFEPAGISSKSFYISEN